MANCIRCGRTISGFTFGKKICAWCKQYEAAQRGESPGYQPVMAVPWKRSEPMPMLVTQLFFGINVAVFVGMLLSHVSPMSPNSGDLVAWGANLGSYTLTGDWWRLVASCFVHIGIIHLGFNMWCLWSLGELAERLYGHVTFACVYLLCGIGGSLGSVLWHSSPIVSAGASGAIFGIAGAVIASIKLGEFASGVMAQSVVRSLLGFVGYNVVFGLLTGMTDNACHVGGLVTGLLLVALIAKGAPEPRLMQRMVVMVVVAALLGGGGYALWHSRGYRYLLMRAGDQVAEGKIDAAIPLYERAAKAHPESALAVHYHLAQLYIEKKDLSGAERELVQVQALQPKGEQPLYDLGQVRLAMHKTVEAQQTFEQLLAVNQQSAEAHAGLGAVALAEGNAGQALKEFEQAEALNGRLEGVYEQQGACLLKLKRYDEAIAAYQKEVSVSGESPEVERGLAEAYKAKGMTAEADAALKRAEQAGNAASGG